MNSGYAPDTLGYLLVMDSSILTRCSINVNTGSLQLKANLPLDAFGCPLPIFELGAAVVRKAT
jgi:hypothetical protein